MKKIVYSRFFLLCLPFAVLFSSILLLRKKFFMYIECEGGERGKRWRFRVFSHMISSAFSSSTHQQHRESVNIHSDGVCLFHPVVLLLSTTHSVFLDPPDEFFSFSHIQHFLLLLFSEEPLAAPFDERQQ